jgi:hypothetical protein
VVAGLWLSRVDWDVVEAGVISSAGMFLLLFTGQCLGDSVQD